MKPTPTPKTDAAVFAYDRGDREAVVRLARDFERRIHRAMTCYPWSYLESRGPRSAAYIKRLLTRSTSRKPSASQNKPKAARRAKR